jgi:GTP-binding protein EngB required for normal cell division
MERVTDPEREARRLQSVVETAGQAALGRELAAAMERAREGRFYVALVGQFKRGKSTLVNALLGADLLPTGVAPVTSVITLVRWGRTPRAVVHGAGADVADIPLESLADFVTEAGNPGNRRGVRAVEIEFPADWMASGLCLVDTPGVGSVIGANARETQAFVPHIDVALAVLGVDPPITAAELELFRPFPAQGTPLVVVLNKADLVRPEDLEAGSAFTRQVLREQLGYRGPLLAVAARGGREGRALPDGRADGGIPELRQLLGDLARHRGAEFATLALARTVRRVRETLTAALELERRALTEPAEVLQGHVAALEEHAGRIRSFLQDFGYRLQGELDRFQRELHEQREALVREVELEAASLVAAAFERLGASPRRWEQRALERAAWEALEQRLAAWEERLLPWVQRRLDAIAQRFRAEAEWLFLAVRDASSGLLGDAALPEPPVPQLRASARYYFAPDEDTLAMDASKVLGRLRRWLLPRRLLEARLARRLERDVVTWAGRNATRCTSEIWLAAWDARRAFEHQVAQGVGQLRDVAEQALRHAQERRAAGEAAVAQRVARIEQLLAEARGLEEVCSGAR